jgi:hypothetical protein
MFNPRNYENSRPDGFGVLEVAHDDTEHLFVPLQRTELSGEISAPSMEVALQYR